jgi:hypothetical protein
LFKYYFNMKLKINNIRANNNYTGIISEEYRKSIMNQYFGQVININKEQ